MQYTEEQIKNIIAQFEKIPGVVFADYTSEAFSDLIDEIMIDYENEKLLNTLFISIYFDKETNKFEYAGNYYNLLGDNIFDDAEFDFPISDKIELSIVTKLINTCEAYVLEHYGDCSTREGQQKILNNEFVGLTCFEIRDAIETIYDENSEYKDSSKITGLLDKLEDATSTVGGIFLMDRTDGKTDTDIYSCIDEIMRTLHYDNGKPLTTDDYNYFDHYDRYQDYWSYCEEFPADHFEINPDGDIHIVLDITYDDLKRMLTDDYDGSSYEHDFGDKNPLNLDFD